MSIFTRTTTTRQMVGHAHPRNTFFLLLIIPFFPPIVPNTVHKNTFSIVPIILSFISRSPLLPPLQPRLYFCGTLRLVRLAYWLHICIYIYIRSIAPSVDSIVFMDSVIFNMFLFSILHCRIFCFQCFWFVTHYRNYYASSCLCFMWNAGETATVCCVM